MLPTAPGQFCDRTTATNYVRQCTVNGQPTPSANPTRYEYIFEPKIWIDAEYDCISRGGHLASIHSLQDQQQVKAAMQQGSFGQPSSPFGQPGYGQQNAAGAGSAWIGLHDHDVEGGCSAEQFLWTDQTEHEYQNWVPGEPNSWGLRADGSEGPVCDSRGGVQDKALSGEDCVVIDSDVPAGQPDWKDQDCDDQPRPYVCGFPQQGAFVVAACRDSAGRTHHRSHCVAAVDMPPRQCDTSPLTSQASMDWGGNGYETYQLAATINEAAVATARRFDGQGDYVQVPNVGTHCDVTIDAWVRWGRDFRMPTDSNLEGRPMVNHPIMNEDNWDEGDLHYQIYNNEFGFDVNGNGDYVEQRCFLDVSLFASR